MAGVRLVGGGAVRLPWLRKRWAEQDDERKEPVVAEFQELL